MRILRWAGPHDTMATQYEYGMSPDKHLIFCSLADLREQKKITKWIDELRDEVTALDLHGKVIVTSSVCFHMGGEFDVDWKACQFRCRWHDWRFDINTGESLSYALPGRRLKHYQFVEREGNIELPLPQ